MVWAPPTKNPGYAYAVQCRKKKLSDLTAFCVQIVLHSERYSVVTYSILRFLQIAAVYKMGNPHSLFF